VTALNGGLYPSSGFPNCPHNQLPTSNSNTSQRLNCSSLTLSLTHQSSLQFPALHCTALPIYLSICGSTALVDLGRFIMYLIHRGWTPLTGDQPLTRPLTTHRTTQPQNKLTQTSMPQVGFEPTIPAFERAKTVHTLERAATAMGKCIA
jgi:hypothetical protein